MTLALSPATFSTPRRVTPFLLGWITLLSVTAATLATRAEAPPTYHTTVEKEVVYGTTGGNNLTLHLALPKDAPTPLPVIAFIHGGGWRAGNKDLHLSHIDEAAQRGYAAVSIGYRLVPGHRWPAQIEDVKCAIRWLRAHADQHQLDPQRIGAIGFSAGAHLSMLLGTMGSNDGFEGDGGWQDQSSQVQAVVAYFGPTKFFDVQFPALSRPLVEEFLGGSQTDATAAYRAASPVTYASPGDAPTLIFQGTNDVLVPYEQAFDMVTALTKARVPGRVDLILGAGHGWEKAELARTVAATWDFFDQHLRPAQP